MVSKKKTSEEKAQLAAQRDFERLEEMAKDLDKIPPTTYLHGVMKREPEQEFGRRLQELRESKGMTQGQLADATKAYDTAEKGISRAVISLYETGTNRPGLRELRILCEVFRANPAALIYGSDDPFDSFYERHRFGFYATSNPEFLAVLTYSFSLLSHHQRMAIMEIMEGLRTGKGRSSPNDLNEEAAKVFLKAADELRERRSRQEQATTDKGT